MKQHSIHIAMIKQVAERLGPLRPRVVFLGGSSTGFHILEDELFLEALPGHLLPDRASQARRSIILEKIKQIVEFGNI